VRRGFQAIVAPRSAAMSAAPSIRPASRGVAVAIASTAARPRALSIRPIRRVAFARRSQEAIEDFKMADRLRLRAAPESPGAALDPSNASRSETPARVSSPLIRSACSAPSEGFPARYSRAVVLAAHLIAGRHGVLQIQDCNVGAAPEKPSQIVPGGSPA